MIIIPARLNSSRFENKILVDILGLPMVIRTAKQVQELDDVTIATDSQDVIDLAASHGINAVMTSSDHQSGTDRINEAASKLNLNDDDIVINVQADEPFIEPNVIKSVIDITKQNVGQNNVMLSSCYKLIDSEMADDPNHVKVITDNSENAIYFSRNKIPYNRDHHHGVEYKGHLGIYGFTAKTLRDFCELQTKDLENIEKLEQLRAISSGASVSMVKVQSQSFGIDTQEDLNKALEIFS
ncbi:MAG: 3-deoxy-manno-octulosonate cytidylyltransferase [Campylobacteraceae bacterium]|nr:3-deoxy-manno-octulosonate cytidylyltransferase [Campylobacteraceae bacterium]